MNGIGAGFILNNSLYDGDSGQSGEIGHTSINFNGPQCACGNRGCLDLYANLDNMNARILELRDFYPHSFLLKHSPASWSDIISAGNSHDALAINILEEFCTYISYSLATALNLLNLSTVIVGYDSADENTIIESLLQNKLNRLVLSARMTPLSIIHSSFNGDAPLIGTIALVAAKIFSGKLVLEEFRHFSEN